jgi:hypothetical protein
MTQLSALQCPACGVESRADMPDDACVYFWDCPACATLVKPLPGDCCVFCSYGSALCPPKRRLPITHASVQGHAHGVDTKEAL